MVSVLRAITFSTLLQCPVVVLAQNLRGNASEVLAQNLLSDASEVLAENLHGNASDVGARSLAAARILWSSPVNSKAVVDIHNSLRANVGSPCTAGNMPVLEWRISLTDHAQKWAEQLAQSCDSPGPLHDPGNNIQGENIYFGLEYPVNYSAAVQSWYDEGRDAAWTWDMTTVSPRMGDLSTCTKYEGGEHCAISRYLQVVSAKATHIGCGMAKCTGREAQGVYFVCRYNTIGVKLLGPLVYEAPWISGRPCTACPHGCVGVEQSLCKPNSIIDCEDRISKEVPMHYGAEVYPSCATYLAARRLFCDQHFQSGPDCDCDVELCPLSCGTCLQLRPGSC